MNVFIVYLFLTSVALNNSNKQHGKMWPLFSSFFCILSKELNYKKQYMVYSIYY